MKECCLSEEERKRFFETDGYLVVPNALSESVLQNVLTAVDHHASRFHEPSCANVNMADVLGMDDAFLELIDVPRVFPKIWGILGWNIWVNHSHVNINPSTVSMPQPDEPFCYGWHRDGGSVHQDVRCEPPLLLMVKVGYYLTDVAVDGGPTWIIKDSHLERPHLHTNARRPANAYPLIVQRGSAVIFGSRVVHSTQSPNYAGVTRKAVFLTYAYRWLQALDAHCVEHLRNRTDDVRQQLLGFTTTFATENLLNKGRSGRYYPKDEDVPLRTYIARTLGRDARQYVARTLL